MSAGVSALRRGKETLCFHDALAEMAVSSPRENEGQMEIKRFVNKTQSKRKGGRDGPVCRKKHATVHDKFPTYWMPS